LQLDEGLPEYPKKLLCAQSPGEATMSFRLSTRERQKVSDVVIALADKLPRNNRGRNFTAPKAS
jgi:hypothetical protein